MKISVVIPCRNEENHIEECIHAIFACVLPLGCEMNVFVVDGMSDDATREKVQALIKNLDNLFLVNNEKKLTPYAFNLGIYQKQCDYVQIVGARHIISENYLFECINKLENDQSIWCVGGRLINFYTNNESEVISYVMGTSFGMGIGNFRTLDKSCFTDTVTSPMYPCWVFEKIGYFDEDLIRNQDDDFNYRVSKAGGKIYFISTISLNYYVRASFTGLKKQFFQYGYWKVFVNKKHKTFTTIRQLIPPIFVLYVCLLLPCLLIFPKFYVFILAPLACYLVLLIHFVFKGIIYSGFKNSTKIAKCFLVIHMRYGLGYLSGIMDFIILNKKPTQKNKELTR